MAKRSASCHRPARSPIPTNSSSISRARRARRPARRSSPAWPRPRTRHTLADVTDAGALAAKDVVGRRHRRDRGRREPASILRALRAGSHGRSPPAALSRASSRWCLLITHPDVPPQQLKCRQPHDLPLSVPRAGPSDDLLVFVNQNVGDTAASRSPELAIRTAARSRSSRPRRPAPRSPCCAALKAFAKAPSSTAGRSGPRRSTPNSTGSCC